jgi:hypothetical protein
MQTHRDIEFGDGVYTFKLGMKEILAIEEKCGARIGAVYAHVMAGRYDKDGTRFGYGLQANFGLSEILEICRQGLIGGGSGFVDGRQIEVKDHLARHLIRTYVEPDAGIPLTRPWDLAEIIMETCLSGYEPAIADAQKKSPRRSRRRPTDGSTEARSSATA